MEPTRGANKMTNIQISFSFSPAKLFLKTSIKATSHNNTASATITVQNINPAEGVSISIKKLLQKVG